MTEFRRVLFRSGQNWRARPGLRRSRVNEQARDAETQEAAQGVAVRPVGLYGRRVAHRAQGGADVDDAPVVRFVNKVMLDAIKRSASDIHFEPYEKHYRIRLRQDGVLTEIARPPVALAMKVAARLKVMARLDIAERRVPQDGRIRLRQIGRAHV